MKISILLITIFSLFFFTEIAEAKVLPQAKNRTAVVKNSISSGITVSPRLRADRRALEINFGSLQNASAVSYVLTYATSTQEEGAMGNLRIDGSSSSSVELLFGICSKNVCRYHTGITNMHLEVSYIKKW